jgi:hypothetical protein
MIISAGIIYVIVIVSKCAAALSLLRLVVILSGKKDTFVKTYCIE